MKDKRSVVDKNPMMDELSLTDNLLTDEHSLVNNYALVGNYPMVNSPVDKHSSVDKVNKYLVAADQYTRIWIQATAQSWIYSVLLSDEGRKQNKDAVTKQQTQPMSK
ncbi:hypothetical protein PHYSODRAFT_254114 [Phytophthora sojae]|uniref:Uncharacterized protein n=1 Tax=Phytophthora sojae (strain P6497) TaxID=1094619 RepID=G5A8S3_PHYSP|nr:hypothetical protein PHYSODRAFT_254114 [Phytophthora sojae]EGZ08299.1 hypothetical protein PHYSODRAFT_254114 [Phytophthora sojae]|eukprot:XP_009536471.1 hypothetical protein PHYSODRAFT_254114 [Phytophthora sojae]